MIGYAVALPLLIACVWTAWAAILAARAWLAQRTLYRSAVLLSYVLVTAYTGCPAARAIHLEVVGKMDGRALSDPEFAVYFGLTGTVSLTVGAMLGTFCCLAVYRVWLMHTIIPWFTDRLRDALFAVAIAFTLFYEAASLAQLVHTSHIRTATAETLPAYSWASTLFPLYTAVVDIGCNAICVTHLARWRGDSAHKAGIARRIVLGTTADVLLTLSSVGLNAAGVIEPDYYRVGIVWFTLTQVPRVCPRAHYPVVHRPHQDADGTGGRHGHGQDQHPTQAGINMEEG